MKRSRVLAAVFAATIAAAGVTPSHAELAAGATVGWRWPGYGPYAPYLHGRYGYGWAGRWGVCGTGACVDNPYLRRAIQRELAQLEHLRELDERAQGGLPSSFGAPPYGARRDWPPPTPEEQVQPAYRGSGDIRPEFSSSGHPRRDYGSPLR